MNREDPLELTDKARALLRAHEPPPIEQGFQQRVLERLESTLGLPPVPPAAPPLPPPATTGSLGLTKILLLAGGIVALGVGLTIGTPTAVHVGAPRNGSAPSTVRSISSELPRPPSGANEEPARSSQLPGPREPTAPLRQAAPKVTAASHSGSAMAATAATASASATSSSPAGSTLAEERALLSAARSALAGGQGSTALRLLSTHAQRFPAGRLSEERESLTIQALASIGAVAAARQRLEALRKRSPRSIFLPALESTLGVSP